MAGPDVSEKVVIVTGAGGGFGRVLTLTLARAGATVAAVDVNRSALDALMAQAESEKAADRVHPIAADLADAASCDSVVPQAVKALGRVDVLVNNAGTGMQAIDPDYSIKPAKFWEAPIKGWETILAINTRAPFVLARAAVPDMLTRGWGRVINVTTSFDTMLAPPVWAYGQSKAALEAVTAGWAPQLKDTGVTVNILVPGGPANTGLIPANSTFPRDKLIDPSVMGRPIRWLASAESDGFTGQRFVAIDWDESLPPAEAAKKAASPAAWPGFGRQARQPD